MRVALLVERSVVIYTAIRLAGACSLVWLGVRTFSEATVAGGGPRNSRGPARRILRDAFVVGLTNPKAAVFFAAILPQLSSTRQPVTCLTLGLVFYLTRWWSTACGGSPPEAAREASRPRPRPLRDAIGGASGVVLVGLGVGLAVTGRKP